MTDALKTPLHLQGAYIVKDDDGIEICSASMPGHAAEIVRAVNSYGAMREALEEIARDEDCRYGYFPGGDPRTFSPDQEGCEEKEIAAHKAACEIWAQAEADGRSMNPEKPSGQWLKSEDGKAVMHILTAPFGIGTYTYPTRAALIVRAALSKATP